MNQGIVIGLDGGGTFTRVAIADLKGNILGVSKKAGSHPKKNQNSRLNVKAAIHDALLLANRSIQSVQYFAGGFAGLNEPEDYTWAEQYILNSGIHAPSSLLNDAEIGQFGAFLGGDGILAIAGTGSIVLGKTEKNSIVRNYDFHHDSQAGSRYLAYSVIYEIISQKIYLEDQVFIESVLNYWEAKDIESLRTIASKGFLNNHIDAIQKLSKMGAIVTNGAKKGNQIAIRACEKVVESLVTGIQLVSSVFISDVVPLSFVGGVANDQFIQAMLLEKLRESTKKFAYKSPGLSPVLGAILYAYHQIGIEVNDEIVGKLIRAEKLQW